MSIRPSRKIYLLLAALVLAGRAHATELILLRPSEEVLSAAFRHLVDVAPTIPTPAVVQVPLHGVWLERYDVAVLDQTENRFVPALFLQDIKAQVASLTASSSAPGSMAALTDKNLTTYVHFDMPLEGPGSAEIILTSASPATFSGLSTLLSPNVALPTHVEVRTGSPGAEKIIVARRPMTESTIRFPATSATTWRVTFTYGQPLRIAELKLLQDEVTVATTQFARFLAHPGHKYRVFLNADRLPDNAQAGEAPNLSSDIDVVILPAAPLVPNPAYRVADVDKDGIPDLTDNCVTDANPDQTDANANNRGDVCDDFDKDGVVNSRDNCPEHPNQNQTDTDGDKQGDACDGEESRLTEANPWLPWAGLATAAAVIIGLFGLTAHGMKKKPDEPPPVDTNSPL